MGLTELRGQAKQPAVLAQPARLGMAKAQGTEAKAAISESRKLLAEQLSQALHLLA